MNFDSDTNVIDVAVRRLRSKIDDDFEPKLIHTVRGAGYVPRSEKSEVQNFPDHTPEPDFSAVMLTVWWLSSFILISTLNGYFDNQDRDFLTGKLQLTEEFLKTETFRNKTDIKSLSEKINDAMVGHNGLFISIKTWKMKKLLNSMPKILLFQRSCLISRVIFSTI